MSAWYEYDEDGFGPDPKGWTSWFELLVFEPPPPPEPDCPGEGHCHGCVVWCDYCGDTSKMCSEDRGRPGSIGCSIHGKYPPPPLSADPRQLLLPFPFPKEGKVRSRSAAVAEEFIYRTYSA